MSIESVKPSSHLILSSPSPPAPNPSQHQGLFQWVNSSHEAAKVLEFQLNISPSNEHAGLISFRMDWLDLLAVKGTLKSLPQHHSSKASVFQHSTVFTVQLSHPYMTTGKTKYWGIIDFQCYANFRYTAKWYIYIYIYIHSFSDSFPK